VQQVGGPCSIVYCCLVKCITVLCSEVKCRLHSASSFVSFLPLCFALLFLPHSSSLALPSSSYHRPSTFLFSSLLLLPLRHSLPQGDSNMKLWNDLERLMALSKVDFTIFFRSLSSAASQVDSNDALMVLEPAFYEPCFSQKVRDEDGGSAVSVYKRVTVCVCSAWIDVSQKLDSLHLALE
jgi:hypothetical protein